MESRDQRILVVHENTSERAWAQQALSGAGRLQTCDSVSAALEILERGGIELVVWGQGETAPAGPRLIERIRREHSAVDLVVLAPADNAESIAEAGDIDVLTVPATPAQLRRVVGEALRRRRLARTSRLLAGRLKTVERCQDLTPCLDPGEVYPTMLELLLELLGCARGIVLFRRPSPLTEALAFRGFSEAEASALQSVLGGGDKPLDPARFEGVETLKSGPIHAMVQRAGPQFESLLAVPVRGDDNQAGIAWILDNGCPFEPEEVARAKVVASYTAAALRNVERYNNAQERAFIDDVTEIYNVRYLLSTTENEIQRADRYGSPLSVLFLDLDHFKQVNDRFGHLIGSQTLRALSQLLSQCVRTVDTLARYGGDEFTILLVDTPHSAASTIAERIRRTVEEHVFEAGAGESLRLAISIGVASFPEHARERDALLDVADKAMYRAKSLGRNRVCSATEL